MSYVTDLETNLLKLSPSGDMLTLRNATEGVLGLGGSGGGKTTSARSLKRAFLCSGMGGVVCVAKPDHREEWLEDLRATGRLNSLVTVGVQGGHYNFSAAEMARQGPAGIGTVVDFIMRITEAGRMAKPSAGQGGDPFWEAATRQVARASIPLLYASKGYVALSDIMPLITSAPATPEQVKDPDWQNSSLMYATIQRAMRSPAVPIDQNDLAKIGRFWAQEWPSHDPKTRANVVISLSTVLDSFNYGRLNTVFCTDTTVVPEMAFHGTIFLLDMPVMSWNEDGIVGQHLFKYAFQRAVLNRNSLEPKHRDRSVFLWADEAQYFVNSYDADYLAACRSSRACTVFITQSLPTFYAKIGGANPKHTADMLLANFRTKIFHNNSDPETNKWASETIGRSIQRRYSQNSGRNEGYSYGLNTGDNESWGLSSGRSWSTDAQGRSSSSGNFGSNQGSGASWGRNRGRSGGTSFSEGYSEQMDFEIEASDFSRYLRTGGPEHRGRVSAIWFQAGRTFKASNRNYLHVEFQQ